MICLLLQSRKPAFESAYVRTPVQPMKADDAKKVDTIKMFVPSRISGVWHPKLAAARARDGTASTEDQGAPATLHRIVGIALLHDTLDPMFSGPIHDACAE